MLFVYGVSLVLRLGGTWRITGHKSMSNFKCSNARPELKLVWLCTGGQDSIETDLAIYNKVPFNQI
ncbi:protein of unknown function [Hyphomicrobium sp. MC1]|nr:protein of unknown function [Hyphomicrobium sp. MC1]